MKRKIIGFGEIVYDIIFKHHKPIVAQSGGSVLNMMITLSRLGVPVVFVADLVDDIVGRHIAAFLQQQGINIQHIFWHSEGKSRIALTFLNENNDAENIFFIKCKTNKLHPLLSLSLTRMMFLFLGVITP